jgi:alkanesulfonate monooxygenase SsuD/methylene tetrahydromethanopterin reductase-like flavin-dependent oxidoreductase (luciferase family)
MTAKTERGVGVEGALGANSVGDLAQLAEACGYTSFWLNVFGADADPIGGLREALGRTSRIQIGVGLFPLDRFPAAELAPRLSQIGPSMSRAIVGLAAGQAKQGVVSLTEQAIRAVRAAVPACRIATGGYGPNMLALGGRLADAVLANWLMPERLDWLLVQVRAGGQQAGRSPPPIYLYHRAAAGAGANDRLKAELAAYRRYPVHERHQAAMGNPDRIGVAANDKSDIERQIAPYAGRCRLVLRPLPEKAQDLDEWRSLIRFFAPVP